MNPLTALRLATVALLFVGMLATPPSSAFQPENARVVDRLWAHGQPWVTFTTTAFTGPMVVRLVGVNVSCVDPISGRYDSPAGVSPEMCPGGMHAPDVYVHLFRNIAGEDDTPLHCTAASCEKEFGVGIGFPQYGMLVHGGPNAPGRMTGTIEVWGGATLMHSTPLDISGSIMVDVAAPAPEGQYEVHSVLVSDGPVHLWDGSWRSGNAGNDHLGVDATEMWVLDAEGRVIGAEANQQGVGPAAYLNELAQYRLAGMAWVVVRPWMRPGDSSFDVRVREPWMVNPAPVWWADGTKSPFVGDGRMRVIVNTLWDDADHDFVSSAVEKTLETCDGLLHWAGRWPCLTTAERDADMTRRALNTSYMWSDPRDTDGDGLSDRAEIFGVDETFGNVQAPNGTCNSGPQQYIEDADQTLPLWAFSPRHKDALIELDTALLTARDSMSRPLGTCVQGARGCGIGAVLDPTVPTAPGPSTEMFALPTVDSGGEVLAYAHARFAELPGHRVGNPDTLAGIELHFDGLGPMYPTVRGAVPRFDYPDASGRAHPGLVIFNPPGRSGSNCSCLGLSECPSPRHAGLSHYVVLQAGGGGGESGYNVNVAVGYDGPSLAHELGHHFGLGHGGPGRALDDDMSVGANHNPFGWTGVEASDIEHTNKLVFFSLMNYEFGGGPFSIGQRGLFPIPRLDPLGVFGYPEVATFDGRPTHHVASYDRLRPGPLGCGPSAPAGCADVDFSRDMTYAGTHTGVVETRAPSYLGGKHNMLRVPGRWCSEERRIPNRVASRCCNAGSFINGTCRITPAGMSTGGPVNNWTTNTMLLAASPAPVTLNNRLYTFFIDDQINAGDDAAANLNDALGQTLPRRCTPGQPCTPSAAIFGQLRWSAVDGFRIPEPFRAGRDACLGLQADCVTVTPGARAFGTVSVEYPDGSGTVDGPVNVTGTTDLAATVLRDGAGAATSVVLAWTSRTSFQCTPRTDACRATWGPMEVRFIDPAQLETGTFRMVPAGQRRPTFPAGPGGTTVGARISSVSLVAWNPGPSGVGAPDKALLIVREAAGTPVPPQRPGGLVWYAVCDGSSGCGVMQSLTAPSGAQLRSDTDLGVVVDAPPASTGVSPGVVVAVGDPVDDTDVNSPINLWRFSANSMGGLTGVLHPLYVPAPTAMDPAQTAQFSALPESGLSIAFARDNSPSSGRMFFVAEQGGTQAAGVPVPYQMATTVWPFAALGNVLATPPAEILWGYTRPWFGWRDAMGAWVSQVGSGPGHVPALFFDDRVGLSPGAPAATVAELGRLEQQVRTVRVSQEAAGPTLFMTLVTDVAPSKSLYDYDETATLEWQLCRTITGSSRGTLWPELRIRETFVPRPDGSTAPSGGVFRCPSTFENARSSVNMLTLAQRAMRNCRGPCIQWNPPSEIFDHIAQVIANPYNFATAPSEIYTSGPLPARPDVAREPICVAEDPVAAYQFVEGSQ